MTNLQAAISSAPYVSGKTILCSSKIQTSARELMCHLFGRLRKISAQLVVARRDSWRMSDLQRAGNNEIQNGSRSNEVEGDYIQSQNGKCVT